MKNIDDERIYDENILNIWKKIENQFVYLFYLLGFNHPIIVYVSVPLNYIYRGKGFSHSTNG